MNEAAVGWRLFKGSKALGMTIKPLGKGVRMGSGREHRTMKTKVW